jgi:hypothetical protein
LFFRFRGYLGARPDRRTPLPHLGGRQLQLRLRIIMMLGRLTHAATGVGK